MSENSFDNEKLQQEYEDSLFRLAMAKYAHEYGKQLQCDDLDDAALLEPDQSDIGNIEKAMGKALRQRNFKTITKAVYKSFNKIAVVALVVVSAIFITTMNIQALRVGVLNFFIDIKDEYTSIRLKPKSGNSTANEHLNVTWTNSYVPTYIPDGFYVVAVWSDLLSKSIEYASDDGRFISYSEYSSDTDLNVDTENAELIKTITIQGYDALLVNKNDFASIIWSNDERFFFLSGKISNNEAIKIAENVKFIE